MRISILPPQEEEEDIHSSDSGHRSVHWDSSVTVRAGLREHWTGNLNNYQKNISICSKKTTQLKREICSRGKKRDCQEKLSRKRFCWVGHRTFIWQRFQASS